jgi:hypothetical protein
VQQQQLQQQQLQQQQHDTHGSDRTPSSITATQMWDHLSSVLVNAANTILPTMTARPRKPYISSKTLQLIHFRKAVLTGASKTCCSHSMDTADHLKRLRHKITRQLKRDKQTHAEKEAQRLEKQDMIGNPHGWWTCLKRLGASGTRPTQQIAASDGSLIANSQGQADAFAVHFDEVHRCGVEVQQDVLQSVATEPNAEPWEMPSMEETVAAIKQLKHWRAADPAGIRAELLQTACTESSEFVEQFHHLIITALQQGMPATVKQSELLPFFKKGDRTKCSNYRGIQLISMLRKVIAIIISKRLCTFTEEVLLEYQCGFRPQRSCTDQLFSLRKICGLAVERQQRVYIGFVDLQKAFESVSRPALWAVLRARKIPEQLITILEDLHTFTTCRVRVQNSRSDSFTMQYGVQQGCPLANPLFNLFMDWVVREALDACRDTGITVEYRYSSNGRLDQPKTGTAVQIPLLMFADDLAITAPTAKALSDFFAALEAACKRWGLIISPVKTELMVVGDVDATACTQCGKKEDAKNMLLCHHCSQGCHTKCHQPPLTAIPEGDWVCPTCQPNGASRTNPMQPPISISGVSLPWVSSAKYLGSHFQEDGGLDREISRRIQLSAAAFRQLEHPFYRQRVIRLPTRIQVYHTMVISVTLYGSESWALTQKQLGRLEVFHHGCIRAILGVSRRDHIGSELLLERSGSKSIADLIRTRQLRWLGHIGRMAEGRLAKRLLFSTMAGQRRRGKPQQFTRLDSTYQSHLDACVTRAVLRENENASSWLDICQDRHAWKELISR